MSALACPTELLDLAPDIALATWTQNVVWGNNRLTFQPVRTPGLLGTVVSLPQGGGPVGGDVYFITVCTQGYMTKFVLLDVAGHGADAAALAARLQTKLTELVDEPRNEVMLGKLNQALLGLDTHGAFATAVAATYHRVRQTWRFAYAGHPLQLVRQDGNWQPMEARSEPRLPVGVVGDVAYEQTQIRLDIGDWVMLFSDGLVEIPLADGTFFDEYALLDLMNRLGGDDPHFLAQVIAEELIARQGHDRFPDDVTFALFKRVPG